MSRHNLWLVLCISLFASITSSGLPHQRAEGINNTILWNLPLPASGITTLQMPSPPDSSRPVTSPNAAHSSSGEPSAPVNSIETALNAIELKLTTPLVTCDGSAYGRDLSIASCQEAWELLPKTINRETFGQRQKGDFNVPLPNRVLSCTEVPHQSCVSFSLYFY